MGREENLEKLNKELKKDIKEECQVICIMSRIRKALEQHEGILGDKYSLLKFYCHWTLHPKLNNTLYVQKILDRIAEAHKNQEISGTEFNFISFRILRKEIIDFLKVFNLKCGLLTNERTWKFFRRLLLDILIDCPLEPKIGAVERFAFKKPKSDSDDMAWEVKYFDDSIIYSGSMNEINASDILIDKNNSPC